MSAHGQYDRIRAVDTTRVRLRPHVPYDRRRSIAVWLPEACAAMRERNAVCWCGRPNGHDGRHRRKPA
jgi:hypothetical protein